MHQGCPAVHQGCHDSEACTEYCAWYHGKRQLDFLRVKCVPCNNYAHCWPWQSSMPPPCAAMMTAHACVIAAGTRGLHLQLTLHAASSVSCQLLSGARSRYSQLVQGYSQPRCPGYSQLPVANGASNGLKRHSVCCPSSSAAASGYGEEEAFGGSARRRPTPTAQPPLTPLPRSSQPADPDAPSDGSAAPPASAATASAKVVSKQDNSATPQRLPHFGVLVALLIASLRAALGLLRSALFATPLLGPLARWAVNFALKYREVLTRCAVTVAMLAVIRCGLFISLPGVDMAHLPVAGAVSEGALRGGWSRCATCGRSWEFF